jgi:hypothetical protein
LDHSFLLPSSENFYRTLVFSARLHSQIKAAVKSGYFSIRTGFLVQDIYKDLLSPFQMKYMYRIKSHSDHFSSLHRPWQICVFFMILSACACSKNSGTGSGGGTTPGGGNGDSLLSKEIIVGKNASNVDVDSVVTNYQYDASGHPTQFQQTSTAQFSGATSVISVVYNLTYSNNLVSGLTGTVTQSIDDGGTTFSSNSTVNTVFTSSGNHIVAYVQTVNTTGTSPFPTTLETGNDSALIGYDANGNVSSLNIYQLTQGAYEPVSQQTFTYSAGNLTQLVNVLSVSGVPVNTVTSVYTYNTKISAAPVFIVPGVTAGSTNDITGLTQTTTGTNPQTINYAYQTTYNSASQPLNSSVTLTNSPSTPDDIVTEQVSYFYQ